MTIGITHARAEARYARKDAVDIRDFGARPNTNCTAAFDAARAASDNIYVPEGAWNYYGDGLSWGNLFLRGAGRSKTIIGVGTNGGSLIVGSGISYKFALEDLRIDGGSVGFGAIRLTGTGANVATVGGLSVQRVDFLNYTGAAISHQFSDCPNWTIRDCVFGGANDTSTMGVALHGDSAHCTIENCAFGKNKVHVKIGFGNGGNATKILGNDFVRSTGITDHARIDLWIVPTSTTNPSSLGALVQGNKFGPEGRESIDDAILIAKEDTSTTTDPALCLPDMSAATNVEVRGMRIRNSIFGANDTTRFIRSTTTRLPLLEIDGLIQYGITPNYLIEFVDPSDAGFPAGDEARISGILSEDAGHNGLVKVTNATQPIAWILNDPGGSLDTGRGNLTQNPGGGDRTGYVSTLTTANAAAMTVGAGSALSQVADATGGTDAAEVTSTGVAPYVFGTLTGVTVGEMHWVEFDLSAPATGTAATTVQIIVSTSAGSPDHRMLVSVPSTWRRFRFRHAARAGAWTQLRFTNTQTGSGFKVGRVRAYHAAEAQLDVAGLTATATTAAAAALGPGSDPWLKQAAAAFSFAFLTVTTKNVATGLPTAATVRWSDGTTGAFTATVDGGGNSYSGYAATYGGKTVTASGITYDSDGLALGPTAITVT